MSSVCPQCARRAWLLARLSVRLDFKTRDLARFWSLLELPDRELIDAIGGRQRADLYAAHAMWEPDRAHECEGVHAGPGEHTDQAARMGQGGHPGAGTHPGHGTESVCRHHHSYPRTLRGDALAPHTLNVRGGVERLRGMLDEKVVVIVGTRRASDYGMETARALARGLAASGVTVASGLAEGIPAAVHAGALEAEAATLTVTAGSLERCSPAWCGALYSRILDRGCAISEISSSRRPHGWWQCARARTLALLARLVIVVEAGEQPWELDCAHVARARGTPVAAVPGRVSSPASRGTNALLMSGARLVRDSQDTLDVLYGVGTRTASTTAIEPVAVEPRLASVFERVARGEDTVAKLTAQGIDSGEVAVALIELELRGLLVRGDAGRYVPSAGATV